MTGQIRPVYWYMGWISLEQRGFEMPTTATLYHVTNRKNLASILQNGLDPKKARMKRKSVWGVTRSRIAWAIIHVMAKPWNRSASIGDMAVIRFSISRNKIRRYKKSIWYTIEGIGRIPITNDNLIEAVGLGKVTNKQKPRFPVQRYRASQPGRGFARITSMRAFSGGY